jgi:radical SAM superfamily enzyme YgiQ (UPF0313 family)
MQIDEIISPDIESQIQKVENRVDAQMKSGVEVFDIKVDLLQYMRQTVFADKGKSLEIKHKFQFQDIEEQDCVLMQVPNINESGYYSGIVGLKSWIDKYEPELRVAIIDPVIDYFFLNPPDKQGEFFNLFNTYSKQSQFHLLYNFQEIYDIAYGFVGRYLEKAKPKFLGFSIIDGNIDATLAIAKLVKEKYPEVKILLGGNGVEVLDFGRLPNSNYKTNEYTFLDAISRGDGEMTFAEILKSDWSEESLMSIPGLIWNCNSIFIHNKMRANIPMDALPIPDYSSLEDNFYYKSVYQDTKPITMSRGCPYRCSFCSVPDYIPEYRYRTVENVLEELEGWVAKGKKYFFCHDSIINGNPKWLKELCEKIIERGLDINIGGNVRLQSQMRDIETIRLYRRAGLTKFITGFESYSEPVLKHMKKYTDVQGVREIFENVRKVNEENKGTEFEYPLLFGMQIIVGYLNETDEDFQKTLDFVEEFRDCMAEIVTCSVFLLHQTLLVKWRDVEKEYLEYENGVNFTTKWNTPMDRLRRIEQAEETFKRIGIPYSIYNRGLYLELKEKQETESQSYTIISNEITTIEEPIILFEDLNDIPKPQYGKKII